ncbi:glycosyltransferase family 2 protein [Aeoliella sp. ICT_H6.2]|uniref:Glycosyltransferase family 2 protein n=1 Tax=Aeoliella straminimaris TaxID=2954799 RepID=A0A9X2FAD2_9BACT|nr:glycosyltransferase family A protein [Aeoliella straminimaris]MCO6045347.1 glycosyltransferase family 2 protein [Aeoliella straminimaris]
MDVDSQPYLLITPCRDEAAFLKSTITSVASQTIAPARWVVVDDGSTDETPRILEEAEKQLGFLSVIRRDPNRERSVGPGVIEAFNIGLASVDLDDYAFVCKLDGDLEFGPRYFERLLEEYAQDPWLGTLSGKTFLREEQREWEERIGDENSHGCAKFYRTECFRDIGGFVPFLGWDGIDGHMCRLKGWKAKSMHDPDLKIIHLRRMGSSHVSFWHGRKRWGRYKRFIGSAWYYVLAASMYRMFEKPYFLSGVGIVAGYLESALRRESRFADTACREEVRRFERECLVRGKTRTLADYHARIEQAHPERAKAPKHLSIPAKATASL